MDLLYHPNTNILLKVRSKNLLKYYDYYKYHQRAKFTNAKFHDLPQTFCISSELIVSFIAICLTLNNFTF